MKVRITELILISVLLFGCASKRGYENHLDECIGKEKDELVIRMGQPAKIHSFVDGRRAYEYRFKEVYGGNMGTNQRTRDNASIPPNCVAFFFIDLENNRVDSWKWVGANCNE